jgi:hypothetical protein
LPHESSANRFIPEYPVPKRSKPKSVAFDNSSVGIGHNGGKQQQIALICAEYALVDMIVDGMSSSLILLPKE